MWGWAGFVIATSSVLTSEKKKNNKFTTFKFDAKLKELNTQLTSAIVQSGPSLHYRTGVLQAFSFATGGFYMVPFLPWFLSSHQQDFLWTASSFDKKTQKLVISTPPFNGKKRKNIQKNKKQKNMQALNKGLNANLPVLCSS